MKMESDSSNLLLPDDEITADTLIKLPRNNRNIFLATFAAQLFIVVLGMVSTYSSPACADMQKPGSRFRDITSDEISWIASLPNLSGICGSALSGYVSHRFGRKATLMYTSIPFTISWLLIAYAPSVAFIYAGRILSGFSAGMSAVAVSSYVVEISTTEIRGLLASTFQIAVTIGIFIMAGFGIFLHWSWLAILGAVVTVSGASLLSFMPESPPLLVKNSECGEAIKAIHFLKGKKHDAVKEFEEIAKYLEDEPKIHFNLKDPGLYKPLMIAIILMFNLAFSGYPVILSYSVEVFQTMSSLLNPNFASSIIAVVQMIGTIVSSILMDKAGRRVLYIVSGNFMGLSMTFLGIYCYIFSKHYTDDLAHWTWVPIITLITYTFVYSLGFGPIPFVVIPELVPTAYRSFVMAVACMLGSLFSFIVTKVFDCMQNSIGFYGTFWVYGFFSFSGAAFFSYFVPETKGCALHSIHKSFCISETSPSVN